jgi:hypothetical protein
MRREAISVLMLFAACGDNGGTPKLDGRVADGRVVDGRAVDAAAVDGPPIDAALVDGAAVDAAAVDGASVDASPVDGAPVDAGPGADAAVPYRHTITIDGTDDFTGGEAFTTTSSPTFTARVTWDASYVYVGYHGPDLMTTTTDAATKWLFAYVDLDPGAATGATTSVVYNTQHATFPTGFGAEFYYRWKCDGTFGSLEQRSSGGTWSTVAGSPVVAAHAGDFLEFAIPRATLGASTKLGLVTWMVNEKAQLEGSYAGLYAGNFTDGYAANLTLTKELLITFASSAAPNDPANEGP